MMTIDNNATESMEIKIWNQLNNGDWPKELTSIKPKKWDISSRNIKGKIVLEHFGQIIYHMTLITNPQPLAAKDVNNHNFLYSMYP